MTWNIASQAFIFERKAFPCNSSYSFYWEELLATSMTFMTKH